MLDLCYILRLGRSIYIFSYNSLHNSQMGVLQTGQETDFILVSCTGSGVEPTRREQVLKAKRVSLSSHFVLYFAFHYSMFILKYGTSCLQAGEDSLRRSGLGYTIIRPGPLKV